MTDTDEEKQEFTEFLEQVARFFGGLLLILIGFFISIPIITAIIGIPIIIAGYALYRSSNLSTDNDKGSRFDYRETDNDN